MQRKKKELSLAPDYRVFSSINSPPKPPDTFSSYLDSIFYTTKKILFQNGPLIFLSRTSVASPRSLPKIFLVILIRSSFRRLAISLHQYKPPYPIQCIAQRKSHAILCNPLWSAATLSRLMQNPGFDQILYYLFSHHTIST